MCKCEADIAFRTTVIARSSESGRISDIHTQNTIQLFGQMNGRENPDRFEWNDVGGGIIERVKRSCQRRGTLCSEQAIDLPDLEIDPP